MNRPRNGMRTAKSAHYVKESCAFGDPRTGDNGCVGTSADSGDSKYARGTRSYTMSRIRGKDTSIERLVRSYLFARGFRFRKNDRRYPGHPDIVLPKYHTIVFVNGCFWHMHEGCPKFKMPGSNVGFWTAKLTRNRERDGAQHEQLRAMGWRVIDVWECELERQSRDARLQSLASQILDAPVEGAVENGGETADTGQQ